MPFELNLVSSPHLLLMFTLYFQGQRYLATLNYRNLKSPASEVMFMLSFHLQDFIFHMSLPVKTLLKSYRSLPSPLYNQLGQKAAGMAIQHLKQKVGWESGAQMKLQFAGASGAPTWFVTLPISQSPPITCTEKEFHP